MDFIKVENTLQNTLKKLGDTIELMTDINQKGVVLALTSLAYATLLSNKSTESTSTITTAISNNTTQPQKSNQDIVLQLDENGIPVLLDEYMTVPEKMIAYNKAMSAPEIIAKKKEIEDGKAKKILNELNSSQENNQEAAITEANSSSEKKAKEIKPKESKEAKQIKGKEKAKIITKDKKENKKVEEVVVPQEILDRLEEYKTALDYETDPQELNQLISLCTQETYTSLEGLNKAVIPNLIIFLDNYFEDLTARLEVLKENFEAEGLDNLLNQMYQTENEYTVEEHVGHCNIRCFVEYGEIALSNYYLELYTTDERYKISDEDLKTCLNEYIGNSTATLEHINDENVVGFINYLNSKLS